MAGNDDGRCRIPMDRLSASTRDWSPANKPLFAKVLQFQLLLATIVEWSTFLENVCHWIGECLLCVHRQVVQRVQCYTAFELVQLLGNLHYTRGSVQNTVFVTVCTLLFDKWFMKKVMNYLRKRFEKICLLVSTFFSNLAKMQFFGIARKIYTALIGLPSDKCCYKYIIS